SEERRVGKECRSRWSPHHQKKKAIGRGGAVAIRNTGPITPEQGDAIRRLAEHRGRGMVGDARVARFLEGAAHRDVDGGGARSGSAAMVAGRSYSEARPVVFRGDGIHLRAAGAGAYARLLAQDVYGLGVFFFKQKTAYEVFT